MAERHNLDRINRPVGSQPMFHDDPTIDALQAMVIALLGEVMVLRDRLDANERLAQARGGPGPADVDHFVPDAAVATARAQSRDAVYERVLGVARDRLLPAGLRTQQRDYEGVIGDVAR